jgi:hypothetical protein
MVKSSAAPPVGVVVAAESTKSVATPEARVTGVLGELVAVHERQTAVTV